MAKSRTLSPTQYMTEEEILSSPDVSPFRSPQEKSKALANDAEVEPFDTRPPMPMNMRTLLSAAKSQPLAHLTTLVLAGQSLTKLMDMAPCAAIKILDVSSNRLVELNGLEGIAPTLLELQAHNNLLTTMRGLKMLHGLDTLLLHVNALHRLEGLQQLKKLRTLRADCNSIESVAGLESQQQLTDLNLSQNKLRTLGGMGHLVSLVSFACQFNQLCEIQSGLDPCKKLRDLDLSHNGLRQVDGLRNLTALRSLNVAANSISTLRSLKLDLIDELDIGDNSFTSLSSLATAVRNVEILRLGNNGITRMVDVKDLVKCKHLSELHIAGNPVAASNSARFTDEVRGLFPSLYVLDGVSLRERPILSKKDAAALDLPNDLFEPPPVVKERPLAELVDITEAFDNLRARFSSSRAALDLDTTMPSRMGGEKAEAMVNHLLAKGSSNKVADADAGAGAGAVVGAVVGAGGAGDGHHVGGREGRQPRATSASRADATDRRAAAMAPAPAPPSTGRSSGNRSGSTGGFGINGSRRGDGVAAPVPNGRPRGSSSGRPVPGVHSGTNDARGPRVYQETGQETGQETRPLASTMPNPSRRATSAGVHTVSRAATKDATIQPETVSRDTAQTPDRRRARTGVGAGAARLASAAHVGSVEYGSDIQNANEVSEEFRQAANEDPNDAAAAFTKNLLEAVVSSAGHDAGANPETVPTQTLKRTNSAPDRARGHDNDANGSRPSSVGARGSERCRPLSSSRKRLVEARTYANKAYRTKDPVDADV